MSTKTIRMVSREFDGSIRVKDSEEITELLKNYEQIGVDDCNTELSLRGFPILRGLIGPIAEGKRIARYETPGVFEVLTKEWAQIKTKRRRSRSTIPTVHFPTLTMSLPTEFA